jgi:hypothetical protein
MSEAPSRVMMAALVVDSPMAMVDSSISVEARSAILRVAANDNDAIKVTDDLVRPLPVMRGEGELVRKLLGERFRQILLVGEPL